MIKFVLPAFMAMALLLPAVATAQNDGCCCPQRSCCKRQKCFEVCCVTKEVCRLKMVCYTDECGCTRRKLARVKTTVTRKRLVRTNRGCGCGNGCGSNCGCGCGSVTEPAVTEPVPVEGSDG